MKIIGIIGWKNSGKTFFVKNIISKISGMGINVSSIKRAHHNFEIDKPNTDSYIHRKSGSMQVIISSSNRWAKITELKKEKEKTLDYLLNELDKTDLVIVEGFKDEKHPKIEIINEQSNNFLYKSHKNVIALVSDIKLDTSIPQFKKHQIDLIVKFILKYNNE